MLLRCNKWPRVLKTIIPSLINIYTEILNYSSFLSPLHYATGHSKIARGVDRLINELKIIQETTVWSEKCAHDTLVSIQSFIMRRSLEEQANNEIILEIIKKVCLAKNNDVDTKTVAVLLARDQENLKAEIRVAFNKPLITWKPDKEPSLNLATLRS